MHCQFMRCLCGDSMLYDPEHGKRSFSAWARSHVERGFTLSTANRLANRLAHRRIPALSWLPEYSLSLLYADVMAGITVGVVLIPQGMAYAMLAELPPIYGLYSSLLPLGMDDGPAIRVCGFFFGALPRRAPLPQYERGC